VLRSGADAARLSERLREIWEARSDRYSAERATLEPWQPPERIEMSYIGG